jgi:hypothetical protein
MTHRLPPKLLSLSRKLTSQKHIEKISRSILKENRPQGCITPTG